MANCFPELNLPNPSKPRYVPYWGYWKNINNQRAFFDNLAVKLSILLKCYLIWLTVYYIKQLEDWYYVRISQVCQLGGRTIMERYKGSLMKALRAVYPHYDWKTYRFSRPHNVPPGKSFFSKDQYLLFQLIKTVSEH